MIPTLAGLALALAPLAPSDAEPLPDVVRKRNGNELEGRVLVHNYDGVVLRQGSREVEIPADEVKSVETLETRLQSVLDHMRVIGDGDVQAFTDLAMVSSALGLPRMADLLHRRVLTLDATREAAHDALDHRRRDESWTVRHDGKWWRWEERLERSGLWNRAWEFDTPHYRLRTNLRLGDAVDAALDLERFYLFFHGTLGSELGIHHVRDPLRVHLHADPGSFPPIGHGRRAYYDRERVVVDASNRDSRHALLHEATHQLLEQSATGRRGSGLLMPAWLSEGLAEYFSLSAEGAPGKAAFRTGKTAPMHAYLHAKTEEPLGLTRLLALEPGDFLASEDAALLYAQSWTLVHLCLHDVDDRYREGFLAFLADVFAGKGSPASFREHVATDDEFEAAWSAHARRLAADRR